MSLGRLVFFAVSLAVNTSGLAQPGNTPPPGLMIKIEASGRLLDGQVAELVYLTDATITDLQNFESSNGRTHLSFTVTIGGESYSAIMYGGDWGETDEVRLTSGVVDLVGLWDEYNGASSFVAKWVEGEGDVQTNALVASEVAGLNAPDLVLVEGATITDVNKFVSASLKMHVRFLLKAPDDNRTFAGIAYEGDWNSDTLAVLRSGSANLVGYWDEYQGEPSFVLRGLE